MDDYNRGNFAPDPQLTPLTYVVGGVYQPINKLITVQDPNIIDEALNVKSEPIILKGQSVNALLGAQWPYCLGDQRSGLSELEQALEGHHDPVVVCHMTAFFDHFGIFAGLAPRDSDIAGYLCGKPPCLGGVFLPTPLVSNTATNLTPGAPKIVLPLTPPQLLEKFRKNR